VQSYNKYAHRCYHHSDLLNVFAQPPAQCSAHLAQLRLSQNLWNVLREPVLEEKLLALPQEIMTDMPQCAYPEGLYRYGLFVIVQASVYFVFSLIICAVLVWRQARICYASEGRRIEIVPDCQGKIDG
jgi:hypothetical protein